MASITINIPDDQLQYVLDRFAEAHGYQDQVERDPASPPTANLETKMDFIRRALVERITTTVAEQDVQNQIRLLRGSRHPVHITAS